MHLELRLKMHIGNFARNIIQTCKLVNLNLRRAMLKRSSKKYQKHMTHYQMLIKSQDMTSLVFLEMEDKILILAAFFVAIARFSVICLMVLVPVLILLALILVPIWATMSIILLLIRTGQKMVQALK